ncbi:MAG: helix-turn-helix domain-containing protein, partial [Halobacteriales archaeon]
MTVIADVDRPVETVERAIDLLEYLKVNGPAGIGEIAAEFDCAKSTVHRHLRTLEANSFLVEEDGEYCLGTRLLDYGIRARDRYALFREARPKVDEL